jgi:hypothetical protein
MQYEEIVEAGKRILTEILGMKGPSVERPNIEKIVDGHIMTAGNARLHMYDMSSDKWYGAMKKSQMYAYPGSPKGHFVDGNVTIINNKHVGWYLTVQNAV